MSFDWPDFSLPEPLEPRFPLRSVRYDPEHLSSGPYRILQHDSGDQVLVGSRGWAVTFFIPLPEPLLLPDEFIRRFLTPLDWDEYFSVANGMDEGGFRHKLALSLCFRRVEGEKDPVDDIRLAQKAATAALPGMNPDLERAPIPSDRPLTTVVEVFGLVSNTSERELTRVFDESLVAIKDVQEAYGAAVGSAVEPVSLRRCPMATVVYRRKPNESDPKTWHLNPVVFLTNERAVPPSFTSDPIDAARITVLDVARRQISEDALFSVAGVLMLEGKRVLDDLGDTWSALSQFATASEMMLDESLCSLLWEEGRRPEDCSAMFNPLITARVKNGEHQRRLGGDWDIQGSGAIGEWFRYLALPRNEMVHSGRRVDNDTAKRAWTATVGLRDHLRTLLVEHIDRYPRTAWMLLGENGMDQDLKRRHLDPLFEDPAEPHWHSTCRRWIRAMQHGTRFGRWANSEAEASGLALVAIKWPSGEVVWTVVDEPGERAFTIESSPAWLNREVVDRLVATPVGEVPVSIRVAPTGPLPRRGNWRPGYRLLPNVGVMVDGDRLDPPRDEG